ncbi:PTS cellobiose transporter subunit IIB [Candidatus Methylomirabilis lanthanidiphila]|uniref:PTS cellobiose transporter subunit IIB n=1 Tax=Candidatus Methylomirabilis lanthanidiphila TaxID=2211376 RepID=A0A564ZND3_9BACT|nr:efflux RND transporter periplasmic adaptor subunit [Candidatus Methylomirabilis lanthanidiphila]VUZ86606.1 PTS cellobiose transporter subunit IIB [Candidatus Methylomirabilis lanthanidiphila]
MQRTKSIIAWGVLAAASVGIFLVWYAGGMSPKDRSGGDMPPPRAPLAQSQQKGEHTGHDGMSMPASQETQTAAGEMQMTPGSVMVSPERQQLIGLKTGVVEYRSIERTIRTVGVVEFDERRLAEVNIKIEGWIESLLVNFTGERVKKGQPLLTIYSPDLVSTQEEYLQALRARETLAKSRFADIASGGATLVDAARRRLQYWDISDEEIAALERTGTPRKSVTIDSPINGVVIEKMAFRGKKVMPGEALYKVADLSTVWVQGEIYEYEVPLVKLGQKASVTLGSYPGEVFRGKVSYIYPVLTEKTRTVKVRFELANTNDWKLKPQMYANVGLKVPLGKRLVVPDEAVLDSGTQQLVFIDKGQGTFEPRDVNVGARVDGYAEILTGLSAGERVVTSANFLIDSESQLKTAVGGMGAMPGMEMGKK